MGNRKDDIPQTTKEIEQEINRLRKSPFVKYAKMVDNQKLKQKLYQLRSLERRGRKLLAELNEEEEKMGIKSPESEMEAVRQKMEVLSKIFIKRKDLQILTGLRTFSQVNDLFVSIRKQVLEKLDKEKKILPHKDLIPLDLALDYLKVYGVSKKKIYEDYERLLKMQQFQERSKNECDD